MSDENKKRKRAIKNKGIDESFNEAMKHINLVYKFLCRQCNSCLVGKTRSHLITCQDSEIANHKHKVNPVDFSVLYLIKKCLNS